jgi:hypothetical protein
VSGQVIQFFIQIAPIALGALFVIVLKIVKFPETGIEMRFSQEIPKDPARKSEKSAEPVPRAIVGLPTRCSEIYGRDGLAEIVAAYLSDASQGTNFLWHGYIGGSEDMRDGVFERMIHDELITNGFFDSNVGLRNSRNIAFEKLGILDEMKADNLSRYLTRHKKDQLRLFALGSDMPLARVLSFEGESGLLLAYLAGYNLEVVGD